MVRYAPQPDESAFDIDPVIARLKALQVGGKPVFQQVRGAADLAAIEEITTFRPPEAFVVLMVERGKKAAGTRQAMAGVFSVVIAARNYQAGQGKPVADDVRALKSQVRTALVGWIPNREGVAAPGARGCEWLQGGVVDYSAGTMLWSDVFSGQQFIGSRPQ